MQTNPVVTRALQGGGTDDHTANRAVSGLRLVAVEARVPRYSRQ